MNLGNIEGEQIHAILVLVILNLITFFALASRLQTDFTMSCWCNFF